MRMIFMCSMLGLALVFAGCAPVRSGVYTLASTKSGEEVLGHQYVLVKKDATATVSKPVILFPMGVPRDYTAMEQILEKNNGDVLTNVRITSKYSMFWLLFFFGSTKAEVTADVWRIADRAEIEAGLGTPLFTADGGGDALYTRGSGKAFTTEEESQ